MTTTEMTTAQTTDAAEKATTIQIQRTRGTLRDLIQKVFRVNWAFKPIGMILRGSISPERAEDYMRAGVYVHRVTEADLMAKRADQKTHAEDAGLDPFRGGRLDRGGNLMSDSGKPVFGWDPKGRPSVCLANIFAETKSVFGLEFTGMRLTVEPIVDNPHAKTWQKSKAAQRGEKEKFTLDFFFSDLTLDEFKGREVQGMTEKVKELVRQDFASPDAFWGNLHIWRNRDGGVTINAVNPGVGIKNEYKKGDLRLGKPGRFNVVRRARSVQQVVDDAVRDDIDAETEETVAALNAMSAKKIGVPKASKAYLALAKRMGRHLPENVEVLDPEAPEPNPDEIEAIAQDLKARAKKLEEAGLGEDPTIPAAVELVRKTITEGRAAAQAAETPAPAAEDETVVKARAELGEALGLKDHTPEAPAEPAAEGDDLAARIEKARRELMAGTNRPADEVTAKDEDKDK